MITKLKPGSILATLLDNCCSNPYYPPNFDWDAGNEAWREYEKNRTPGQIPMSGPQPPGGWNIYSFSLHCVTYELIARKKNDEWQVKSYGPRRN